MFRHPSSILACAGAPVVCEPLEQRSLLSASLKITVDGKTTPDTIDFGRALQNSSQIVKQIKLTNDGTEELTGFIDLINSQNCFIINSGSGAFDLDPSNSLTVNVAMLTDQATIRSGSGLSLNVNGDNDLSRGINFKGEVDKAGAAQYSSLGSLGSGTVNKTGSISAILRNDSEGTVVYQINDALYGFSVATTTSLQMSFSGSGAIGGMAATLLPDQSGGTNHNLTIAERNAAIITLSRQTGADADMSAATQSTLLGKGFYFIYISSTGVNSSFDDNGNSVPASQSYALKLVMLATDPGRLSVSGKGVIIASGDTSPSTLDGTSFGTAVTGTPETLTYTITNTGGSAVTVNKSVAIVSGDFQQTTALPSTIGAHSTATFSITPISTAAGNKSGTVSLVTDIGTYSFAVGGIFTPVVSVNRPSKLTAVVNAKPLKTASSSYKFFITYSDPAGIDTSSLGNYDVQIKGPTGFRPKWCKLITFVTNKDKSVTVEYHVSPLVGAWTKTLNGGYKIYIRSGYSAGKIKDKAGNDALILKKDGTVAAVKAAADLTVAIG